VNIKKKFQIPRNKKLVPRMLNHRENVRTRKFWQELKEKIRSFFRILTKAISGFDLGQKNSKLSHAMCTFNYMLYCKNSFIGHLSKTVEKTLTPLRILSNYCYGEKRKTYKF
jgi:hypothetical protein